MRAGADQDRDFDLCIIGAGISGLNALFVAKQYLAPGARVALIDSRPDCGGMWNTAYDHVRLHQPHPMFTVGDMEWNWTRPADYLATGTEVLAHLKACRDRLRDDLDLTEIYEHEVIEITEDPGDAGPLVTLRCHPVGAPDSPRTLTGKRVIHARGFDVPTLAPLSLSSADVLSTTPERVLSDIPMGATAPIFVVGGGKTGMDTAATLLRERPGAPVTLLNGRGTLFLDRDLFAPTGLRRWFAGHLVSNTFARMGKHFDGTNADTMFVDFRKTYTLDPIGSADSFFFGFMSRDENARIKKGLNAVRPEYLDDVVDGPGGPQALCRSGTRFDVPKGSAFVNCTGHLLRHDPPSEPYISEHGAILTISTRSAIHFLSSVSAYFLTHMFLRGALPHPGLYALDFQALARLKDKSWQFAIVTASYINTVVLIRSLPTEILDRCGLDLDRWFPLHRRLLAFLRLKYTSPGTLAECAAALDRLRRRHDIAGGPILRR